MFYHWSDLQKLGYSSKSRRCELILSLYMIPWKRSVDIMHLTGDWPGQAAPDVGHAVKCWPTGDRLCFEKPHCITPTPLLISMPRACQISRRK